MGLSHVKGIGQAEWKRIQRARQERQFSSVADFVTRSGLNDGKLTRLAEADAFACFENNRRIALWQVKGLAHMPNTPSGLKPIEKIPAFKELEPFDAIDWDYRTMAHSARGHPLVPLRRQLKSHKLPDAEGVNRMHGGRQVRFAGMVICRQRPGTAGGVVFLTLEDESGFVNVVVWQSIFQKYDLLIKTSNFLGVSGTLQKQDNVVHVVAESFWDPQPLIHIRPASGGSRDFH
jgi:error-prone DNA polymerase